MTHIERYFEGNHGEIKIDLPEGESFICVDLEQNSESPFLDIPAWLEKYERARDDPPEIEKKKYIIYVIMPYTQPIGFDDYASIVLSDGIAESTVERIMHLSAKDLTEIIRQAIPGIEKLNRDEDLEI